MNADELYTLLNDLPDDYVTAAAGTHRQSRRPLYVIVPAVAACITLLIAAAVYPKLRIQRPEVQEPPYTAQTTVSQHTEAVTTAISAEPEPEQTVNTTASADTAKVQAAKTTAVTTKTQPETPTQTQAAEPEPETQAQTDTKPVTTQETDIVHHPETTAQETGSQNIFFPETTAQLPPDEAQIIRTVPFSLSRTRTGVPQDEAETPIPATTPTEHPGESTAPIETAENPTQIEHPADAPVPETCAPATTAIATEAPVTVTTVPTQAAPIESSQEPPRPPLAEFDGKYCIITPRQPFADVTLTGGVLDADGVLHLELTGLRSSLFDFTTMQITLMLPDEIAAQVRSVTAHITAEENETAYDEIAGGSPVIYDETGQGG